MSKRIFSFLIPCIVLFGFAVLAVAQDSKKLP